MPTAPAKAIYPTACYFTVELANLDNPYTTMALDTPNTGNILLTFVPTTLTDDSFDIIAYYTDQKSLTTITDITINVVVKNCADFNITVTSPSSNFVYYNHETGKTIDLTAYFAYSGTGEYA